MYQIMRPTTTSPKKNTTANIKPLAFPDRPIYKCFFLGDKKYMTGKTLATNSVDESIDVFTNIINEAYQQCTSSTTQSQVVDITGNTGVISME